MKEVSVVLSQNKTKQNEAITSRQKHAVNYDLGFVQKKSGKQL